MKRVWLVLSVLCVANVLALAGFVGWLSATDRLSKDRVWKAREMFATTIAQQKVHEASEAAVAAVKAAEDAEAKRRAGNPESSPDRIAENRAATELLDQQLTRMREESRQLQEQIKLRREDLEKQTASLDEARRKFHEEKADWDQARTDEQFQQAIGVLEAQKPADAVKVLRAIIDAPSDTQSADTAQWQRKQKDTVIRYLSSVQDRVRAKIMAEFVKSDEKLAAELLEMLRTRGTEPTARVSSP
jgi:hypothetical protein